MHWKHTQFRNFFFGEIKIKAQQAHRILNFTKISKSNNFGTSPWPTNWVHWFSTFSQILTRVWGLCVFFKRCRVFVLISQKCSRISGFSSSTIASATVAAWSQLCVLAGGGRGEQDSVFLPQNLEPYPESNSLDKSRPRVSQVFQGYPKLTVI